MADSDAELATRASLLQRLRDAGDTASWQTFATTYAPLVYGYYRKHSVQDADAADLTQEVLARVARAMRTFEYQPQRGRFRDWLGTVTRHQLATFLARRRPAPADAAVELDALAAPTADTEWDASFHAHVLRVALEGIRPLFEPATWEAFTHVWQHDRPARDVARELDLPIDKVYAAKARVLKRLREEVLMLAEDLPQDLA